MISSHTKFKFGHTLFKCLVSHLIAAWTNILSRDMTKPTKWLCAQRKPRSAWASAQSDQSLRCALKLSSCGQRRLWSDWEDAQADLSFRWAHSHFVGFVMSRLIFGWTMLRIIVCDRKMKLSHVMRKPVFGFRPGKTQTGLLSYSD